MNEGGSLLSGVVIIAVLVGLLLFIIRGREFRVPSPKGISRRKGSGAHMSLGRSRTAGKRSVVEVFFALFAVANLAASPSVDALGAPLVVLTMLLLVAFLALSGDFLIVVFGAVAAFLDVALADGTKDAFATLVIVALLAWIYGGVRHLGGDP